MTTAQIIFAIALAVVAVLIVGFTIYVVSSTMWSNRWTRHEKTEEIDGK